MKKALQNIRSRITTDSLDCTLSQLMRLAIDNHFSKEMQELEAITSTYRYLKQYLLTGYNDSKRETLYLELKQGAYEISSRMLEESICEENRSFAGAREIAEKSALSIDETIKDLSSYEDRGRLFNIIYSTLVLSASAEKALTKFLTTPEANFTDVRLIISALMLSQQVLFDVRKFRILTEVCCTTTNEDIRQYALIAMVFAQPNDTEMKLYDDDITSAFRRMSAIETIQQELMETQLQVLLSTDTKETQKTITEEIMPVLRSKAVDVEFNVEKSEEQLLDEILHPDKEEKTLEDLEKSIDRIRQLRDAGADIFFGGFSQTKRFPFFYTLMNWFVPFSIDHPQVASLSTGEVSPETIVKLMDMQNFCDSDKYSFYFTFSKVVQQIPHQLLEMLRRGEVTSELGEDIKHDTTYRRRLYLQDLYRFYSLYSSRIDFFNPFANEKTVVFFTWEPIKILFSDNNHLLQIARQLLKRNMFKPLDRLLDPAFDELNLSYLKLKGLSEYRQNNFVSAMEWFRQALVFEPENPVLIRKMAETAMFLPDYDLARQFYNALITMAKDGADTCEDEYNYALCCLQTKDAESAMKPLYKLYYLHENNIHYRQALAWGLLLSGKYEEAKKIYFAFNDDEISRESSARKALSLWVTRNKAEAIASLRSFTMKKMISPQELSTILLQQNEACNMKIDEVDLYVITDLTFDNSL